MNFGKCLIYGIVIGVLIIILIKLIKSIKETFDETIEETTEVKETETTSEPTKETSEPTKETSEPTETKEIKSDEGIISTIKSFVVGDKPQASAAEQTESVKPDTELVEAVNESELEGKSDDLTILPKFVDTTTSSVMDGVKLIPQKSVDAWQDVYMNSDNDNSFMIDLGGDDKATNKDQGSGRFNDRSPACCSPQYPVPFKLKVDKQILKDSKEFVPNPYMGNNNWMNAGCTCMKKVNASKLAKRGGNA